MNLLCCYINCELMKKNLLFFIVVLLLSAWRVTAQDGYTERAKKYIDQYCVLAMEEQRLNGIPAAITLGQGILETEAGASELMTEANNHFGIKCGNGWMGETFSHTDDAPDECFKKYKCVQDSYRDHSEHLKRNPRYSSLFSLSQTDYAGWAVCLKRCGYATNPQYAQRLIKIIEDFKLQEYTYAALNKTSPLDYPAVAPASTPIALKEESADDSDSVIDNNAATAKEQTDTDPIKKIADSARNAILHPQAVIADTETTTGAAHNYENSKLVTVNGLKAFYAYKDEMLLQYAVKFNVRYPKLLEMNDLPDAPLAFNTYVYVEKKHAAGTHSQHAVKDGETMLMISQTEGVQLKRLIALNLFQPGEEPANGAILELQFPSRKKPLTRGNAVVPGKKENNTAMANDITAPPGTDYVATSTIAAHKTEQTAPESIQAAKVSELPAPTKQEAPVVLKTEKTVTTNNTNNTKPETTHNVEAAVPAKPALPAETAAKSPEKYYTVKKGDTAFSIAKRNNISLEDLEKWNNTDGSIQAGQVLQVKE